MSHEKLESGIQLGELAEYSDVYDATFLQPIPRAPSRKETFGDAVPFSGVDIWTCFELSWLNPRGVPQVAVAEFRFDCMSENIIESKSFKYYLNSFNQTVFTSIEAVQACLVQDLSAAANGNVAVEITRPDTPFAGAVIPGVCVDQLDCDVTQYSADASLLSVDDGSAVQNVQLYSHLLKSNCPVTGQPDWATIWIEYTGKAIHPEAFLAYVVSYRQHQDFHETCVEKFFADIMARCKPSKLSVFARYTRRGGLDINPFRSNCRSDVPFGRLCRQ